MMKLLIFSLVFFISGCGFLPQSEPLGNIELEAIKVPHFLLLENASGKLIGRGIPLGNDLFVAPDHLLPSENLDLFWKGDKINILVRDFENDLFIFRIFNWSGTVPSFSKTPPEIGKDIFWFSDDSIKEEKILMVGAEFEVASVKKKNLIKLSGVAHFGDSGSVIFDHAGLIYGMIIGSAKSKNSTFATRSDVLLDFVEESLSEK